MAGGGPCPGSSPAGAVARASSDESTLAQAKERHVGGCFLAQPRSARPGGRVKCMDERERRYQELIAYAREESAVVGLYVFGSRAREDELRDDHSDYDVGVVLQDGDGVLDAFDARWPYVHGASVEIARATLAELRSVAHYGRHDEWSRYLYSRVNLVIDKTGEVGAILHEKRSVPEDVREQVVRDALDGYINFTYRSMRYRMVGAVEGARLDAAESLPPLLTAIFAMDGRVRPFNKYLASELREQPLSESPWAADRLIPQLMALLAGDILHQQALFRDVDDVARNRGFAEAIEEWQPDVAWLRGEAEYRTN